MQVTHSPQRRVKPYPKCIIPGVSIEYNDNWGADQTESPYKDKFGVHDFETPECTNKFVKKMQTWNKRFNAETEYGTKVSKGVQSKLLSKWSRPPPPMPITKETRYNPACQDKEFYTRDARRLCNHEFLHDTVVRYMHHPYTICASSS